MIVNVDSDEEVKLAGWFAVLAAHTVLRTRPHASASDHHSLRSATSTHEAQPDTRMQHPKTDVIITWLGLQSYSDKCLVSF